MDSQRRSASVITSVVAAPAAAGCAGISGGPDPAGTGGDADTYTPYAGGPSRLVDRGTFSCVATGVTECL